MERRLLFNCCIVCLAFHVFFKSFYVQSNSRNKKIWTIEFELISAVLCDQEVTDFKLYKKKTKKPPNSNSD